MAITVEWSEMDQSTYQRKISYISYRLRFEESASIVRFFSYLMQNDDVLESMGILKDIQDILNELDQNEFLIM